MITIPDTTKIIARAAIFDQRISKPSNTVIGGWADEFNKHDLELHDLLAGVSAYYEIGRERVIQPGDVIRAARDIRQRRAQVENAQAARALPAGQPPQWDGTVPNADGTPVTAAYEIDGALDRRCGKCNAQPGHWCTSPAGRDQKIPHLARLRPATTRRTA